MNIKQLFQPDGEEVAMHEETCCFTGYRPTKLPWGEDEQDPRALALKARIAEKLEEIYERGFRHYICGMARGCDLYFAEAVLDLRNKRPGVRLEAALPCPSQADDWPAGVRARYTSLLEACDLETLVQRSYTPDCMHRRNRYMVERSALLLAVYDGQMGGTAYTLLQAMRAGLEIVQIKPE